MFNDGRNIIANNHYRLWVIDNDGNREIILDDFKENELDLSFIDARKYPYMFIELICNNADDYTPPNPKDWIVHYDYLPEGLINTEVAFNGV